MKNIRRMARWLLLLALALGMAHTALAQAGNSALVLTFEGPITPVVSTYLQRGIAAAEQQNAQVLILRLNTPGGQIELMNRIVNQMLESDVPIVVYVSPRGAIAGSAGTLITLAAHANAMAPGTAIGAASPVGSQGEDIQETLDAKIKNVLKAQVRNLAANRSEEAIALAEATIEEAKAATAIEAKEAGLTDFIAVDVDDLLRQLDGFEVSLKGQPSVLHTAGIAVVELPMGTLEEMLSLLTNPNVVFLLLALGAQAILIELSSPGGWVSGFIGVVALALAFYGLGVLPVNWFGIVFILLAFVLFILDIQATSHGALTAAAVGSLIVGALVLFNSPGSSPYFRVSVPLVIGTSVLLGGLFIIVLILALRARRRPVEVGVESLIGKVGVVQMALNPAGTVQLGGELWSAECDGEPIAAGERVVVVSVNGLRLNVRRA